jgi:hypothetical protein
MNALGHRHRLHGTQEIRAIVFAFDHKKLHVYSLPHNHDYVFFYCFLFMGT